MWVLLDADNGIMIHQDGLTRVFAAGVRTKGILTKLANALCLDWDQNADSSLLCWLALPCG